MERGLNESDRELEKEARRKRVLEERNKHTIISVLKIIVF